ncbi:MAG: flagellar motor protein MotD [Gammaproteobacteria bacterium]
MARKKKPEEHENHERWLVSYADFITLLFAFFVVMYSISSVNEGKYRVLSDALVAAFRSQQKSLAPIQVGTPVRAPQQADMEFTKSPMMIATPAPFAPRPSNTDGDQPTPATQVALEEQSPPETSEVDEAKMGGKKAMEKIADDVEQAMTHLIDDGLISIFRGDLILEIEIKNSILYKSGSANIQPDAMPVLEEIAKILSDFSNPIRVEGYTDNFPISTLVYPSNWELSAARAAGVVRLFSKAGVEPDRMVALGYGEFSPVGDNSTVEGRAQNRRVMIVVLANHEVEDLLKGNFTTERRNDPEVNPGQSTIDQQGADMPVGDPTQLPGNEILTPATEQRGSEVVGAESKDTNAGNQPDLTILAPPGRQAVVIDNIAIERNGDSAPENIKNKLYQSKDFSTGGSPSIILPPIQLAPPVNIPPPITLPSTSIDVQ